ncbi:DNA polymerase subunit gamma-2, mitochondrial-like isoform X3 [Centruroides sculpturatus]|uniref:DNA polymerase subunit gamma-2, mitochondrial-like isoform X3 n=1 Tax=Centruroides sculpturatus TaxID=218467 RepID=UPI000C6CA92F|nr:DNA polymerase subunit gamma-2, mitochondrial-like isoform X3 [Centruroides sculpturatus]
MSKECVLSKLFISCQKHGYLTPMLSNKNILGFSYGPLGTELYRNIVHEWWNSAVRFANIPVFPSSLSIKEQANFSSLVYDTLQQYYKQTLEWVGGKVPFGIANIRDYVNTSKIPNENAIIDYEEKEIVKAWTPQKWTSLNLFYICSPKKPFIWLDHWHKHRLNWWRKFIGCPSDLLVTDISQKEENKHELDIQYKFPWGIETVEKLTNLGSSPMNLLKDKMGIDCNVKDGRKIIVPHMITCESSLDLAVMMYLLDAFQEKERMDKKRQVMKLHFKLVPYKVVIASPASVGNATKVQDLTDYITMELKKGGITVFPNPDLNTPASLEFQFARFVYR